MCAVRGKPRQHCPAKLQKQSRSQSERTTLPKDSADYIETEDEQQLPTNSLNHGDSPASEISSCVSLRSEEGSSTAPGSIHDLQNLLEASTSPLGAPHALQMSTKTATSSCAHACGTQHPGSSDPRSQKHLQAAEESFWKVSDFEDSTQQNARVSPRTSLEIALRNRWGCLLQQDLFDMDAPEHDAKAVPSTNRDVKQECLSYCQRSLQPTNIPTEAHGQTPDDTLAETSTDEQAEQGNMSPSQQMLDPPVLFEIVALGERSQVNQHPSKDSPGEFPKHPSEDVPTSHHPNSPEDPPLLHEMADAVQTIQEEKFEAIAMRAATEAIRNYASLLHDNHARVAASRARIAAHLLRSPCKGMLCANLHYATCTHLGGQKLHHIQGNTKPLAVC